MLKRDDAKYLNAREFSRVDAFIPMNAGLLPAEKAGGVRSRISHQTFLLDFSTPGELEDKILSDWLTMLNAKLDYIISTLHDNEKEFSALPFRQVNISAGGMSFASGSPYSEGDTLEIKMILQMQRPIALCVYGEVVKAEKRANEFYIAVRFIHVDDEIRDGLVRYVFERQREILREKRK